jgi:5'-phosphate synthase pdxT subunit
LVPALPPIGVLALQGDVREHLRVLTGLGVEAVAVRRPAELAAVSALVLPGGESTTMIRLAGIFDLLEPLRERIAAGMPAFGTCAGMILLASELLDARRDQRCFGAIDITVRRNAFGRQVDSFETDLTVRGVEGPVHAVFIRAPVVETVGRHVKVLARVDGRPVVCRQGPILVSAFHPELSGDRRLHQLFLDSTTQEVS